MSLKEKFEFAHHWDHFEKTRKENPDAVYAWLMETTDPVEQWPKGVKPNTHIPGDPYHFYTVRGTHKQLEEICSQPVVRRLTL